MDRHPIRLLTLFGLTALLTGLLSCQGGSGLPDPGGNVVPGELGFTLNILGETYLDESSAKRFDLKTTAGTATTTVEVSVDTAESLKALYYSLSFDPTKYNPLSITATDAIGSTGQLLDKAYTQERGILYHGQVLLNPASKAGLNGSSVLAKVVFEHAAQPVESDAATAASNFTGKATLSWDSESSTLSWPYTNQGDYNQDGVVSITDLTPIAQHNGVSASTGGFKDESYGSQLDGSGDGVVDVADADLVLSNWGQDLTGGYKVYASGDCETYPVYDTAPSIIEALSVVPLSAALGDPYNTRLEFQYQVTDAIEGLLYWVRPVELDGTEGRSSELLLGDPAEPGLWLVNPPTISPRPPYVVENGATFSLILDDPTDGNVTTATGVNYRIEPAEAATISGDKLEISASYKGWFSLHATYNGTPVQPGVRETSQSDDGGGLGFFIPQPDSIFALPSLTEVQAGGQVTMTVYAYQTASPFRYLNLATLVPSDDMSYVPGSLNIGSPGNESNYPDGVWAELQATEFMELPDNFILRDSLGNGTTYAISVTPLDGHAIDNATGALFNFDVMVISDSHISINKTDLLPETYYSVNQQPGSSEEWYQWTYSSNEGAPGITTYGETPELVLRVDNPPLEGDGSISDPYQVGDKMEFQLSLLSNLYGDITTDPGATYTVVPEYAGAVTGGAILVLEDDYSGTALVKADFGGISTDWDSNLYMFLSGDLRDDYLLDSQFLDTSDWGPGTYDEIGVELSNYWDTNEDGFQEEFLKFDVVVSGAQDLGAIWFTLTLNSDLLKFSHLDANSALNQNGDLLILPDLVYRNRYYSVELPATSYDFSYAAAVSAPLDENGNNLHKGFSGDGTVLSLLFHKAPIEDYYLVEADTDPARPRFPQDEDSSCKTYFDGTTSIFKWYYYSVGDYNQNGVVSEDDIFPLALFFGRSVPSDENSVLAVVDGDHDGKIHTGDLTALISHFYVVSRQFRLFAGPVADYPNQGDQLGLIDGWDYQLGDPMQERIFFEYEIPDPQAGDVYWVKAGSESESVPSEYAP